VTEGIKKEIAETDIIKTIAKTNKGKTRLKTYIIIPVRIVISRQLQLSWTPAAKYCALCRLPGMEDVVVKRCKEQSCTRVASYKCNISGASFCVDHVPNMTISLRLANPTCDWTDCDKKKPMHAEQPPGFVLCTNVGMVDVVVAWNAINLHTGIPARNTHIV
jgi:hypothetical protein